MQITPDGDITQTGVAWNQVGYGGNPHHTLAWSGAGAERPLLRPRRGRVGRLLRGALGRRAGPEAGTAPIAVVLSTNTWNAYNNFGGRCNYINADRPAGRAAVNARQELDRAIDADAIGGLGRTRTTRTCRSRSSAPSRATTSPQAPSPTDPIAGRQASTSPRRSGGCWPGWSARASPTTSTPTQQLHDGTLDLDAPPGPDHQRPSRVLVARDVRADEAGSTTRAAGCCTSAATG